MERKDSTWRTDSNLCATRTRPSDYIRARYKGKFLHAKRRRNLIKFSPTSQSWQYQRDYNKTQGDVYCIAPGIVLSNSIVFCCRLCRRL